MKRIIAVILVVALLLGIAAGCSSEHFRFSSDTSVTKGEWITLLASRFGFDDFQSQEPYYSDVNQNDDIFQFVQSCREWNVLRDEEKSFKKNEGATIHFVITTAVFASGADLTWYTGTDEEKAIQHAIKSGIIPEGLDYSKWATAEQCSHVLDDVQRQYLSREITPIDKVVYNEQVQDLRTGSSLVQINANTYLFTSFEPKPGEIYIAPGDTENPTGIAIKVLEVQENGDSTFTATTTLPELYEVFNEIEFADVVIPNYEDIVPAEGVEISEFHTGPSTAVYSDFENCVSTANSNDARLVTLSYNQGNQIPQVVPLGMGTSKKEALSFTAKCNFTKGTVSVTPSWDNKKIEIEELMGGTGSASPEGGKLFEKTSIFPDKTLFGPDKYSNEKAIQDYKSGKIDATALREALKAQQNADQTEKLPSMTNKFSGGYEIVGEIAITDLYIVPTYKFVTQKILGIDTGIPVGIENFTIETNYGASASLSIKGKIENELTVCSVPVTMGGVATLTVEVILYSELNGELSVKTQVANNTKVEYANGNTRKTSTQSSSASGEMEVTFEAGPGLKAKLSLLAIPFVDVKLTAAVQIKGNGGITLSNEWTETDDSFVIDRKTVVNYGIEGYVPIVKFKIGSDKNTLANKLNISFSWTLIDSDSAYNFSILPSTEIILWQDHLELPKDPDEASSTEAATGESGSNGVGSNMRISSYYIHLTIGESKELSIEFPEGYNSNNFVWKSDNEDIASISNGTILGKQVGSTIITASSTDGLYYAKCAVYVGENVD